MLTAHARDEGVSAAAGTTDERASDDRNVVLMPAHRGEERARRAPKSSFTPGELGEEVDGGAYGARPRRGGVRRRGNDG